ncbi:MAG: sigma-54-dependent Fis family transcriptional regulator [Zetaproteobacteria bacterium]|nr:sigma-54-dependent Fis family transcriptional regulator [Zetaproteobacteria bacterium]
MTMHVMIVDDEAAIRDSLQGLFEDEGFLVSSAASGEEAIVRLRTQRVDCILLDIWMPGIDGLETLERIHHIYPQLPVIMMSGHATIDTAVRATRQGAYDFVEKPLSSEKMLILVRNALAKRKLEQENNMLKSKVQEQTDFDLVGHSPEIKTIRNTIHRIAKSNAHLLILGEHGTGKNIVANMIHQQSMRAQAPFLNLNIASFAPEQLDTELFGSDHAAFPGATSMLRGRFETHHGGTAFLDEIADIPLGTQAKLLRIMLEKKYQIQGRNQSIPMDIRLIGASTYPPEKMLEEKRLREDFYYRINVVTLHMPPLRERIGDLPLLIESLSAQYVRENGAAAIEFTDAAIARMQDYDWHGNVRELRNYIERCHILLPDTCIGVDKMPTMDASLSAPPQVPSADENLRHFDLSVPQTFSDAKHSFERQFLLESLNRHDWNISRTANEIGVERTQLHRKIKSFGLIREGNGQ